MPIRPLHRPTLPRSMRTQAAHPGRRPGDRHRGGHAGHAAGGRQRSGRGRAGGADAEPDRGRARHDGRAAGGAEPHRRPEPDLRRAAPARASRHRRRRQAGAPRAAGPAPHRLRRDADRDRGAVRHHHRRPRHPEPPGGRVAHLCRPAAAHLGHPSPGASRPWRIAALGRRIAAGTPCPDGDPHRARRRDAVRHRRPLSRDGGRHRRRQSAGQPVLHQDRAAAAHPRGAAVASRRDPATMRRSLGSACRPRWRPSSGSAVACGS